MNVSHWFIQFFFDYYYSSLGNICCFYRSIIGYENFTAVSARVVFLLLCSTKYPKASTHDILIAKE